MSTEVDLYMARGLLEYIRLHQPKPSDISHQMHLPMAKVRNLFALQKQNLDDDVLISRMAEIIGGKKSGRPTPMLKKVHEA